MNEDDVCAMDPQQRLLLETSYEAIENGKLVDECWMDVTRIADDNRSRPSHGGSEGIQHVGLCWLLCTRFVPHFSSSLMRVNHNPSDYEQVSLRDMDYQPQYAATGTGMAIMSNRISYFYDLRGESITIDTGCSGSLVAVHHACQSLVSGASSIVSCLLKTKPWICTPFSSCLPLADLPCLQGVRSRCWYYSHAKHHDADDCVKFPQPRWEVLYIRCSGKRVWPGRRRWFCRFEETVRRPQGQ